MKPYTPRVRPASAGFIAETVEKPEIIATGATPDEARKSLKKKWAQIEKEEKPEKKPAKKRNG